MFRKIACSILVFTGFSLLCFAASKPKGTPAPTPTPPRYKEDTIVSVSATSITTEHTQAKITSKAKNAPKGGAKITMTYQVSGITDILLDGNPAKLGDLKPGMSATVAADPSSNMNAGGGVDKVTKFATNGDGGLARTINAHNAPTEPSPTPTPKKKK